MRKFLTPPIPWPLVGPIRQVGILVPHLESAVHEYTRRLGLGPWLGYEYGPSSVEGFEYRGCQASYSFRIALAGECPQVELIEPPLGESFYGEWLESRGYGQHHLGFVVPSVKEAIEDMRLVGHSVLQCGFGYGLDGDGGFAYFDTLEKLGVIAEAIEIPARRRPPDIRFDS